MNRSRKKILVIFGVFVGIHFSISIISAGMNIMTISDILAVISRMPEGIRQNTEKAKQWIQNEEPKSHRYLQPIFHVFNYYPIGWFIAPTVKSLSRDITDKYFIEQSISFYQYTASVFVVIFAKAIINSITFGLCLFAGWFVVRNTMIKT